MAYTPVAPAVHTCGECGHTLDKHRQDGGCPGHRLLPEGSIVKLIRSHRCDCVHPASVHDPIGGACLLVNPTFGPCPCLATAPETRDALERVFEATRKEGRQT